MTREALICLMLGASLSSIPSCERAESRAGVARSTPGIGGDANVSERNLVTMDGYDADAGLTVREINLWRDYHRREKGIAGRARHGDRVTMVRREGDGVLVETKSGTRGWVTYYFIRELK